MGDVIATPGTVAGVALQPVDVVKLIDNHPVGPLQIRVVILCGMAALLDGFDLLAIGVAAPGMARTLVITPDQLGILFSAALLGLMLGAFGLGPIADRIGRRRLLIGATTAFGLSTLFTACATDLRQVVLLRFLAGVGLGGAMPSFISLAAEYTPRRRRRQVVALLWTGFPMGGVLVGLLASWLIPAAGWRMLFAVGGLLPLALALLLLWALPESITFLVRDGRAVGTARITLMRIAPLAGIGPGSRIICPSEPEESGVAALFQRGRRPITALLWGSYFSTFLMLITSTAWVPTLLERAGLEPGTAADGVTLFALGSVVGTPLAGILLTRFGTGSVLTTTLLFGSLAVGALGPIGPVRGPALACLFCAGFCLGAASSGLIAVAPLLYPTRIRSTAIGWAMGWGRAGSFVGPLLIGGLLSSGWSISGAFLALGLTGLAGGLLTQRLGERIERVKS